MYEDEQQALHDRVHVFSEEFPGAAHNGMANSAAWSGASERAPTHVVQVAGVVQVGARHDPEEATIAPILSPGVPAYPAQALICVAGENRGTVGRSRRQATVEQAIPGL